MKNLNGGPAVASGAALFAPEMSDAAMAVVLAAGVSTRIQIPPGAGYFNPSFDGNFWVVAGNSAVTAAVPTATTADGSAGASVPVLNATGRRIPDGATHLAFIASSACNGSVEFWK